MLRFNGSMLSDPNIDPYARRILLVQINGSVVKGFTATVDRDRSGSSAPTTILLGLIPQFVKLTYSGGNLPQVTNLDVSDTTDPLQEVGTEFSQILSVGADQTYSGDYDSLVPFDDRPLPRVLRR
jgi:hypothetical protein